MSEVKQDDIVFSGQAHFVEPPNLWAVARAELSPDNFQRLRALQGTTPLTAAMYVSYVDTIRREGSL